MKKLFTNPAMLLFVLSLSGCGSGSEVTVNPAPDITPEQIMQMDEESDRARQEAINDSK